MKHIILLAVLFFSLEASAKFKIYMTGGAAGPETFRTFIQDANHGHIVVLKASDHSADWYNENIPKYGKLKSVRTLIIKSREFANNSIVYDTIVNADGLFIAGGNQFNYHKWWRGTRVEDAINLQLQMETPVGGTSAGLAILGEYYFSAHRGGISSKYAKENPMTSYISIESHFLNSPFLSNTITDTHFSERGRLERLQVFMMRTQLKYGKNVRGIGIDESTSLVLDIYGQACVQGAGRVFVLEQGQSKSYNDTQCFSLQSL